MTRALLALSLVAAAVLVSCGNKQPPRPLTVTMGENFCQSNCSVNDPKIGKQCQELLDRCGQAMFEAPRPKALKECTEPPCHQVEVHCGVHEEGR